MDRGSFARRVGTVAFAALLSAACGSEPPPEPPAPSQKAWSVQLHVHGSFSEGIGSIDSHSHDGSELGVDALWWSDHDFRITSYRHISRFGFEDWAEPIQRGEPWSDWVSERERTKSLVEESDRFIDESEAEISAERAQEGERSLRIAVSSGSNDFQAKAYRLTDYRLLEKRPLASGVRLRIRIFADEVGADARPFVHVGLSEHPPREGLPYEPYSLHYHLGESSDLPQREGTRYRIPLAYRPGEWNEYTLDLTRDAQAGFPFIVGEDNSLQFISLGVEARRGASGAAFFDDLRIEQDVSGDEAFARQRELLDRMAGVHPGLRQLQGVEVSYFLPHLNEFSIDTGLLDYDGLVREVVGDAALLRLDQLPELRDTVARRTVQQAHARGGLVSYNHMFGAAEPGRDTRPTESREALAERLLRNRVWGADLLEVGYRERGGHDLADHLWVWDRLAASQLFLVGIGVSDSHGGRWRTRTNNFVSWIFADAPEKANLIEGMRAGRVYFGDLVLFDGTLDLLTGRGARMGQIVLSDREAADVKVVIRGLAAGDRIALIRSGEPVALWMTKAPNVAPTHRVEIDPEAPTVVRVEVTDAERTAKVYGNPVIFVRAAPAGGIEPARAALDVGGVRSRELHGFTLEGARSEDGGVRIDGSARGGTLVLDCGDVAERMEVRLDGLSGSWTSGDGLVEVRDLEGSGSLFLRPGS